MSTLGRATRVSNPTPTAQRQPQVEHATLWDLACRCPDIYMRVQDSAGNLLGCMFGRHILAGGDPHSPIPAARVKSMFPHFMGVGQPSLAFTVVLNGTF